MQVLLAVLILVRLLRLTFGAVEHTGAFGLAVTFGAVDDHG